MQEDFLFNMNDLSVNVGWLKVYVIQSKNRVVGNIGVNVKN